MSESPRPSESNPSSVALVQAVRDLLDALRSDRIVYATVSVARDAALDALHCNDRFDTVSPRRHYLGEAGRLRLRRLFNALAPGPHYPYTNPEEVILMAEDALALFEGQANLGGASAAVGEDHPTEAPEKNGVESLDEHPTPPGGCYCCNGPQLIQKLGLRKGSKPLDAADEAARKNRVKIHRRYKKGERYYFIVEPYPAYAGRFREAATTGDKPTT